MIALPPVPHLPGQTPRPDPALFAAFHASVAPGMAVADLMTGKGYYAEILARVVGERSRTTGEWVAAFEAAAVPCGPINSIDQVFANEQVLARGLQIGLTRDDGVQVPGVANPVQFSATPIEYDKAAPTLGDGTEKILLDVLGLDPQRIAALKSSGAIG